MDIFSQLTPEEKFQRVLEEITDELKVTPKGQALEIHRGHETDVAIGERHYQKIIAKLEQEETAIKVLPDNRKEGSFSTQWGYPSRFARLEVVNAARLFEMLDEHRAITGLSADSLNLKIHKAAALWGMTADERKFQAKIATDFTAFSKQIGGQTKIPATVKPQTQPKIQAQPQNQTRLLAKYDPSVGVIINDIFRLKKPHAGSENEKVIEFLMKSQNQDHTVKDIETAICRKLTKNLYDIARGLGFEGDLMTLFFPKISQDVVRFNNPISADDMSRLGIKFLPITAKSSKSEKKDSDDESADDSLQINSSESEKSVPA